MPKERPRVHSVAGIVVNEEGRALIIGHAGGKHGPYWGPPTMALKPEARGPAIETAAEAQADETRGRAVVPHTPLYERAIEAARIHAKIETVVGHPKPVSVYHLFPHTISTRASTPRHEAYLLRLNPDLPFDPPESVRHAWVALEDLHQYNMRPHDRDATIAALERALKLRRQAH